MLLRRRGVGLQLARLPPAAPAVRRHVHADDLRPAAGVRVASNLNSSVLDTDNVTVGGVADRGGDGQAVHGRRGGEVRRLPRLGRVEGSVVFLVPVRGTLVFGDGDGLQPLDAPHGGRPGDHHAQGAAVVGGQGVAVHGGGEQDAAAGVHRHVQRYRRAEINAGRVYVCACENNVFPFSVFRVHAAVQEDVSEIHSAPHRVADRPAHPADTFHRFHLLIHLTASIPGTHQSRPGGNPPELIQVAETELFGTNLRSLDGDLQTVIVRVQLWEYRRI